MQEGSTMTKQEHVALSVELFVSSFENSLEYYRDKLLFGVLRVDHEAKFAVVAKEGAQLMIQEKAELKEASQLVIPRIIVKDVTSYYEEVVKQGAEIVAPLEKMSYGLSRFKVKDVQGNIIKFSG